MNDTIQFKVMSDIADRPYRYGEYIPAETSRYAYIPCDVDPFFVMIVKDTMETDATPESSASVSMTGAMFAFFHSHYYNGSSPIGSHFYTTTTSYRGWSNSSNNRITLEDGVLRFDTGAATSRLFVAGARYHYYIIPKGGD